MSMKHFDMLTASERDAAYDNTAAVRNSAQQLADFEDRSVRLLTQVACHQDVRYGPKERQLFDYFPGKHDAPTLIFVHGGYWQMRHKNTFRFVVKGALQQGLNAALIGYTLAPQASLAQIVQEVRQGIAAVSAHAVKNGANKHVFVSGWSAGGHLAALCLECEAVVAGLGASGIYDLAPIRMTYLNRALQLTEQDTKMYSPMALSAVEKPFVIAFGTQELPQLKAQSKAFSDYRLNLPGGLLPVSGADHFSILNDLADPHGALLPALLSA